MKNRVGKPGIGGEHCGKIAPHMIVLQQKSGVWRGDV